MTAKPTLSRRNFLGLTATAMAVGALTVPAQAKAFYNYPARQLTFFNTHTNEMNRGTYFYNGGYDRNVMSQFSYLMRDHRNEEVARMDYRLFDMLHYLQSRLQTFDTINIISGYRSPESNAKLASARGGVARNSYHVKAQAIDIRMDNVPTDYIHRAALSMNAGGVGYYRDSDFVHVDTGPVRAW